MLMKRGMVIGHVVSLSALPPSEVRACVIQGDSRSFSTGRDLKVRRRDGMGEAPHLSIPGSG